MHICYRDDHLVIINKPAGLLSVPGRAADNKDSLATRAQKLFPNVRVVHRLDQPTSGLMIFPLSHHCLSELSKQFQARTTHKRYRAIVHGLVPQNSGEINAPLMADWPNRPRQMVAEDGKPSLTKFRVLARDHAKRLTHVSLWPVTGRSHQLRVHLAHLGHAILGDTLYAEKSDQKQDRLLLHSEFIRFQHPVSKVTLSVCCPAPF